MPEKVQFAHELYIILAGALECGADALEMASYSPLAKYDD